MALQWPLGAVASLGALDTAYLTYAKLTSTPLACPASGSCSEVLNSSYASVGPVPLSFLGLVAYLTVAYLSFNASSEVYRELLWWLCCTMALTSLGLTGLLIFVLQAPCLYCAASAFITAMLLALVETKRARDLQPALAPAELAAVPEAPPEAPAEAPAMEAAPEAPAVAVEAAPEAVAGEAAEAEAAEADLEAGEPRRGVLALSGVVALGALRAGTLPTREFASAWAYFTLVEQYKPNHPPVRSSSSKAEMALAKHLRSIGAACYTAWWCPHCQEQRESFGREATEVAPFVECSSERRRQLDVCKEAEIENYPTWIINGEKYLGGRELYELVELSGFEAYPKESFVVRDSKVMEYIWGPPPEE